MKLNAEKVTVKIMGREYAFVCEPDEKTSLFECCEIVDEKMTMIRAHGKLSAMDRIAVMASLSLAQELIAARAAVAAAEARIAAAEAIASEARTRAAIAETAVAMGAAASDVTFDATAANELDQAVAAVNDRIEQFMVAGARTALSTPHSPDLFD